MTGASGGVAVRASAPVIQAEDSAPEAVAPPPGHPRFPLFDSLRAVAAVSVLLVHTGQFSGALQKPWYRGLVAHLDIGITMFFLISGFLLYRPFVAARVLGSPSIRLRDYARRRFLRIAPAYWLALTALGIFPGIYGVFSHNWWVYYGLLQNYPVYTPSGKCAVDVVRCSIPPVWSLSVELGFYAVLPFFALAMASITKRLRGTRGLQAELAVLAVIGAVSVPIVLNLNLGNARARWLRYSPIGHGWWFALGMGMAALSVWVQQRRRAPALLRLTGNRSMVPWAVAASLYILLCLVILDPIPGEAVSHEQYRIEYLVFGVIAALVLLPAIFGDTGSGLPRRLLRSRVLAWLGLISYGLFLWHWPVMWALDRGGVAGWWRAMAFPILTVTTLAVTAACASISYYLVERPLMRLKDRRRRPSPAPRAGARVGGP
jgi:peptidoglycan/LPS O-acetylase OafA/YrhL